MSAKNSTFLNTLLGLTWGAPMTSAPLFLFSPINLTADLIANLYYLIREIAGSPSRENWYSHWAIRQSFGGLRSKRQGVFAMSFNGLLPRPLAGKFEGMCTGQIVWASRKGWEWYDLPRMLEIWDIDGSPGLVQFDTSRDESAVALIATTGGKVRLHATSWSRGFGNSVALDGFTDKKLPGDTFARGIIHLAEPLPKDFPKGGSTAMRVDEYTFKAVAGNRSVAAIETSLVFILPKAVVQPGQVLHLTVPNENPKPDPFVARVKDVVREPYDGFFRQIELDAVALEAELPQIFAKGKLRVRRLVDTAGTARSGPWQGGPTELTQAEAETLPKIVWPDMLRIEASGGEISFVATQQIEMKLHLTPPLLEQPDQGPVDLLIANARFTALLKDLTEPAKLTITGAHPPIAKDDLLLVRLGDAKKHVVVTAVAGEELTIFPALDFPKLELHLGTIVNVQRWILSGEKDRGVFKSVDGNAFTVIPPRASLFAKGSMMGFMAGGKRTFREIEKITDIKITLAAAATGTAPFTIEVAQFDKSLDESGVDVEKRHRRLKFVVNNGQNPSAYGTFPEFLLGIRPRLATGSMQADTLFFTNGLANADTAHHRTWKTLSEGGNDYWLLGADLPVERDGSDTVWRFDPETTAKFPAAVEVEVVEYKKAPASRADGTPAGARISVHAPEVQVPETPSITDTHLRALIEHEMRHVQQCAHWGPLMFCLPVAGAAKVSATLAVAAGDNPPAWAQRLLDDQGLEDIEIASLGGIMQLLYELFVPGEVDTEIWQQIFSPVSGTLLRLIPDLDPAAGGGEKFGVAVLQILGHALDLRSWTPFLGLIPWLSIDGDRAFTEQQAARASGDMYTTTLSADDRFNADYKTYVVIPHTLRDADGQRALGSATRMMTWAASAADRLISVAHGNQSGSPVIFNSPGFNSARDLLTFTADSEILIAGELYSHATAPLTIEGPASLLRAVSDFRVVRAGATVTPRLRSFVPTPPRVNRSTGYYFIPASPGAYTLTAHGSAAAEPATNIVKLNVTAGNVTLGSDPVPWAKPAAMGAPLDTLPVLQMRARESRVLSTGGVTTGFTADLQPAGDFKIQNEAAGWRIIPPQTFTAGQRTRVRLYRVFDPDDPAFDLTYKDVPTLQGVRSLLVAPVWIPVRDFVAELVAGSTMRTEIVLNGNPSPSANYIGWAPRPATVRLSAASGATEPLTVTLRNRAGGTGGQVVFSTAAAPAAADTLQLTLPANGTAVDFFVAGKFGSPSKNKTDATIEVVDPDGNVLSRTELMVRVRRDANKLEDGERDRFIAALATFNNRGEGRFRDIRNMHRSEALNEAHFNHGFLSWHRAYVMDLERELQKIDPSVTIPYWRFDQPAPEIFSADFLGETIVTTPPTEATRFSPTNPLQFWKTDSEAGILRRPLFDVATASAFVMSEIDTLALGTSYANFVAMENDPHGAAHTSFAGLIFDPATAPRDPIFFLLHANVDRLWARWQFLNGRFDSALPETYFFRGRAGDVGATRIGHNLLDTMWPWNDVTTDPRPSTAPGNGIPTAPVTNVPPRAPTVRDMIDYQGRITAGQWQGFDYDDVPF